MVQVASFYLYSFGYNIFLKMIGQRFNILLNSEYSSQFSMFVTAV